MRSLLFITFLIVQLHAFDTATAAKIYNTIFTALADNKHVDVYVDNVEYKEVIFQAANLRLSETYGDASIILQTKKGASYYDNKLIFTTNYRILQNNENVIGAFYWSKGRPQIIFIRERLEKKGIKLPNNLKKYIVDSL